ncbi:MAG: Dihydroorotate oxidase [Patescibacteria group bacterium]|nr:Dihydroorotate oxidase [Patescibacteria group bacterium]
MLIFLTGLIYRNLVKPALFLFDAELVHTKFTDLGEWMGKYIFLKRFFSKIFIKDSEILKQTISGIEFRNPVGLAAGFDYEAKLTQILPQIGFGFGTIGTITNNPYCGNPSPMLGRLPKSRALLVNKGFKNDGAKKVAEKLKELEFDIPIGISIGRTNSRDLTTQTESVADIIKAFKTFEQSYIKNSYYELNISCPNLFGDISFYSSENLEELLIEVDKINVSKPIFIKMPIEKTNDEVLAMLEVIATHSIDGVIFGNLQKDRKNPCLDQEEVAKSGKGNFSGKPTYDRSNELIALAYKKYRDKLVIIGCGGIFSAEDAYAKIRSGASLVQLITGMIYQGPQLIAEINIELEKLIKHDGYANISEAVGSDI